MGSWRVIISITLCFTKRGQQSRETDQPGHALPGIEPILDDLPSAFVTVVGQERLSVVRQGLNMRVCVSQESSPCDRDVIDGPERRGR